MVRIRPKVGTNSGRRRGWVKWVKGIDDSMANGYAFEGDFLDAGREYDVPVGAVLLHVDPEGSAKNNWQSAYLSVVMADGSESPLCDPVDWAERKLTIRDLAAATIRPAPDNPLAEYSTDDLEAELARRKGEAEVSR